mmetsp:Transcript_10021/g.37964  ORF Transcript_10021/g.37964 Transcript_10021/m.37964 type:complete len:208 (+) Transcript_10021:1159-1782(+)
MRSMRSRSRNANPSSRTPEVWKCSEVSRTTIPKARKIQMTKESRRSLRLTGVLSTPTAIVTVFRRSAGWRWGPRPWLGSTQRSCDGSEEESSAISRNDKPKDQITKKKAKYQEKQKQLSAMQAFVCLRVAYMSFWGPHHIPCAASWWMSASSKKVFTATSSVSPFRLRVLTMKSRARCGGGDGSSGCKTMLRSSGSPGTTAQWLKLE